MSYPLRNILVASALTVFTSACPAQWKILNASNSVWINQNLTENGPVISLKEKEFVELGNDKQVSKRISGKVDNLWDYVNHNAKELFHAAEKLGAQRVAAQSPADYSQLDPWQDDAYCYTSSSAVQLARQHTEFVQDIVFASATARKSVRWPAEEATLAWPAAVPVIDGQQYHLTLGQQEHRLHLYLVPVESLLPKQDMALLLCAKGCLRQVELLTGQPCE